MGREELITIDTAAAMLNVAKTTVYSYISKGLIRARYSRQKGLDPTMLLRDEVQALEEALEGGITLKTAVLSSAKAAVMVRGLESRIERLEHLLQGRINPKPPEEEEVLSLYNKARYDREAPPTSQEKVETWARLLMGINEETLDALESYTDDTQSWQVLYDLPRAILLSAPIEQLEQDAALLAAYNQLEAARAHLRTVVFHHLQGRYGTRRAAQMFQDRAGAHERILRQLTSGQ